MSLSKMLYALLSAGSIQKDRKSSRHDRKIMDWDVKLQNKQGLMPQCVAPGND